MHYRRHVGGRGDATKSDLRGTPLETRLWSRVARGDADACWEWQGYRQTGGSAVGHGVLTFEGRQLLVHRVAFYLTHGFWPTVCRHSCDNPPCCNPAHLLDGTKADNSRDAAERGRARARRGSSNSRAKLDEDQVREIRRLYAAGGVTQAELARAFGVSTGLVSMIITRRHVAWRWLD